MSDIWKFSPSVENLLRQCLQQSNSKQNMWSKEFGHLVTINNGSILNSKHNIKSSNQENNVNDSKSPILNRISEAIVLTSLEESMNDSKNEVDQKETKFENLQLEEILEIIETELAENFNTISEKFIKNNDLLIEVAKRITFSGFEKLSYHMFSNPTATKHFASPFFQIFLRTFLKREYNCVALDLLLKGSKMFPENFDTFIISIINDIDVPNKMLQDYVNTLDNKGKSIFLENISHIDLHSSSFLHHLLTINLAYRDSLKSESINDYIQTILMKHATMCEKDKGYGRLLLAFLQSLKQTQQQIDYFAIEKFVDMHKSPFRRPCEKIVKELKSK